MTSGIKSISESAEEDKNAVDLDMALSIAGFGSYNIKYCLVLALFLIAVIVEPVGYSYVIPAARCDLGISDSQRGFIASVPYIGVVLMSFPWGYLVDTRGRKRVLIAGSLTAGVFGTLAAFMPNLTAFVVCKFITSLCLACPAAIPYSFIGEILPMKYRDIALSIVNAMQVLGSALVPLLAWGILPLDFRIDFGTYEFRSWRLLVIANSSIFFIGAALLTCGPESPKFLISKGDHDGALKVLRRIYAVNKKKSVDDYPVKNLGIPKEHQNSQLSFLKSLKAQSVPLLKPPYLKWLALNGFLLFGLFSVLNGLAMWIPDVVNRVFQGAGAGLTACQVIRQSLNETVNDQICVDTIDNLTFIINAVANVFCALIALLMSMTVKLIGKKVLLIAVYFSIGLCAILINFITNDIVFAILLSILPICAVGIGPVNAYAVEIFPTLYRGMAVSLSMMVGRTGSVVGTNVAAVLLNVACEATFYTFGGLLLLCGALSFLLPPSRKQLKNDYN